MTPSPVCACVCVFVWCLCLCLLYLLVCASGNDGAPMVNLWKRSMSSTPTCAMAAPKSSGRCVMHAPTSRPPFDPPEMQILRDIGNGGAEVTL